MCFSFSDTFSLRVARRQFVSICISSVIPEFEVSGCRSSLCSDSKIHGTATVMLIGWLKVVGKKVKHSLRIHWRRPAHLTAAVT